MTAISGGFRPLIRLTPHLVVVYLAFIPKKCLFAHNLEYMPRPRKHTKPITIEVLPRHLQWFETLLAKTHYGNTVPEIALNLLNEQFKHLQDKGELLNPLSNTKPIPFPTTQPNSIQTKQITSPTITSKETSQHEHHQTASAPPTA